MKRQNKHAHATKRPLCRAGFSFAAIIRNAGLAGVVLLLGATAAQADLTWDASGTSPGNPTDGSGSWSTSASNWSNGSSDAPWNNSIDAETLAIFGHNNGAAGTVTLTTAIDAGGLTFNAAGSGTYVIMGNANHTLTLSNSYNITANVDAEISAVLAGTNGLVFAGAGTLTLNKTNTYTGGTTISDGTVVLTSANGSITDGSYDTSVGTTGAASLTIQSNASFTDRNGILGNGASASGTADVKNATWTNNGELEVGNVATGTLTIENGGTVTAGTDSYIANGSGSGGSMVTVTGSGSSLSINSGGSGLYIGNGADGSLTIKNSGSVTNDTGDIGVNTGTTGTVDVANGTWTNDGALIVGDSGVGTLTVEGGGTVTAADDSYLGNRTGSGGSMVTVTGTGSTLSINSGSNNLYIGNGADATLDIDAGGAVTDDKGALGETDKVTGTVDVDKGTWTNEGQLLVGDTGKGELTIEDGGTVTAGADSYIGNRTGAANSSVTVTGNKSALEINNGASNLYIGNGVKASLTIEDKGKVIDDKGYIGELSGETGKVTVDDGTWTNDGAVTVGDGGIGLLTVKDGGTVTSVGDSYVGNDSTAAESSVVVKDAKSSWTITTGNLYVGNGGESTMTIKDGGTVGDVQGYIGENSGTNTVDVTGSNSQWTNSGTLTIGDSGTGSLLIEKSGAVSGTTVYIASQSGSVGTLQIGNGNNAGTLTANAVTFGAGTGTILFDQNNDITFSTTISGTGTVTQEYSGRTILSGSNASFAGTTSVTDGNLEVDSASALGTSDVTVSGGRLRIASGAPVTTLNVGGTYDQTGGTLRLALLSPAMTETMEVADTTTLGGPGTTIHIGIDSGPETISNGVQYDLVHSIGLISGEFGALTFNRKITLPTGVELLTYTPHDVFLGFYSYLGAVTGLTPNQESVANYIDQYEPTVTTGNFRTLVNNIYPLTTNPTALGSALDELTPQSLQIWRNIAFDNFTFTTQQLDNHLANRRAGQTGFDGSQLTYLDSSVDPSLQQIQGRLLAWNPPATEGRISDVADSILGGVDMSPTHSPACASDKIDPWNTFIAGDVILAEASENADLAYQDYTTGTVTLGADYSLDKHWTVGALLAYAHTDADLDHIGSSTTVDSYAPGLYASYVDGGFYANGLFSYDHNSYTEDRNIQIGALSGTNHGAPEGNQYAGQLGGGYEFRRGHWEIGPTASLQYVHLDINGFTEEGPTALNVQSQGDDSLRSLLGFEARYATSLHTCYGSFDLAPHFGVQWQHEYLNNSDGITSQFNDIGAGSFTVQTSDNERDSAFIDLGVDAQIEQNVLVFSDFQSQAGQDHFFALSFQGGVKVGF